MALEIDVHNCTWQEALDEFKYAYDTALKQSGAESRTVKIIHGYGSASDGKSVILPRIRRFLERHESKLEFMTGESLEGNPGYTLVIAKDPLPDEAEDLEDRILDYCQSPKPMSRIVNEFRGHGQPAVQTAIRILTSTPPLLIKTTKGRFTVYETIT